MNAGKGGRRQDTGPQRHKSSEGQKQAQGLTHRDQTYTHDEHRKRKLVPPRNRNTARFFSDNSQNEGSSNLCQNLIHGFGHSLLIILGSLYSSLLKNASQCRSVKIGYVLSLPWTVSHVVPCQNGEDTGRADLGGGEQDSGTGGEGGQGNWSFKQQAQALGAEGPISASRLLTLLGNSFLTSSC